MNLKSSFVMVRGVLVPGEAPKLMPARHIGRRRTGDIAFNLRMGSSIPGDITRPNPTIEPCLLAAVTPPTIFGQAVVASGLSDNGVRMVQAGDTALTEIYGITVRPFPIQQGTASNYSGAIGFGGGGPPANQPVDILRRGYIAAYINATGGVAPLKGGAVFIWVAASSGAHIQGTFESAATGGSTMALNARSTFQGGVDANGYGEISFNQ